MQDVVNVIAEAMDEEHMMYGDDRGNAEQIIAALNAAGYVVVPAGMVYVPPAPETSDAQ